MRNGNNWLLVLGIAIAALIGCREAPPDRWQSAQQETTQQPGAVSGESAAGSEFNRFFPQVEKPWDIVFKQEKTGFAQASLQQSGREVAVLSVSDTRNNPEAREKFHTADRKLSDSNWPMVEIGEQATAVLVNDRFQVQIRSMDPVFGPNERQDWLAKFNLEAIGRIP